MDTAVAPHVRRPGAGPRAVVAYGVVVLVIAGTTFVRVPVDLPEGIASFVTVWLAICLQALPFLVLGVLVSGAIVAFLPADTLLRVVPRSAGGAVFGAGLFGVVLPGCECGSVPVARALLQRGAAPAPALTFMLAAPAVNPVVLVSTAVAFPGQPMMVIARFLAALFAAWVVGWSWTLLDPHRRLARARSAPVGEVRTRPAAEVPRPARRAVFAASASPDFVHAGGFLVLGAAIAAAVKVLVPSEHLTRLGGQVLTGVLTMAALAVLVCVCSEADAFVAASFTAFSPTAQLVFMTVSPMVDLKLVAMQAGTFGLGFVLRFVPLTLLACVGLGSLVGMVAL